MSKPTAAMPDDELPFKGILSHRVFPGRALLYVNEVADVLRVDRDHVINLIDCGRLAGLDVSTKGLITPGEARKTKRRWIRITTDAYDAFVRSSQA